MYKAIRILVCVLSASLLVACGVVGEVTQAPSAASPTAEPAAAFAVSVEDGTGSEVTLDKEPARIVSLAPNHTEILYALGVGDRLVGVTEYCNYPPEATEKTVVGAFDAIDLELVVGLEPDLVLATTMHMVETVPALKDHGIPVFVLDPQTVSHVLQAITAIGRLTGRDAAAAGLVDEMQACIDAVRAAVAGADRPTVFWELGPELFTAGPGSFIDDMISIAGGENVAADAGSPWPQLTVEAIVLKDPDVIVLADHNYGQTAEIVAARPGWGDIRAVREGKIVEITNEDIVSRPGPRVVEGLEFLARAFHPELFE